jgi:adenosylcobinamide-phosphate synthase
MIEPAAITLAYILDLLIGDPCQIPHPVKGIGWTIEKTGETLREKILSRDYGAKRTKQRKKIAPFMDALLKRWKGRLSFEAREKLAGVILVVIITGLTYCLFHLVSIVLLGSRLTTFISYLSFAVFVYLVSTTIATRDMLKAGKEVIDKAGTGTIEDARGKLSMIVGRDTRSLDRKSVFKATIETLSENASDGIVAPMFYFALGGLPLAMTYKAINTLDSMVGYKNEKYINFGWASAKLDDIVNYIPARITGFLIIAATLIISIFRLTVSEFSKWFRNIRNGSKLDFTELFNNIKSNLTKSYFMNGIKAFKTMIRDGRKHPSPNSGIPEAAMAGALGVRLGGPSTYEGTFVFKPYIGEENLSTEHREKDTDMFYLKATEEAVTITKIVSFLGLLCALGIFYMRVAIWN